MKISEHDERFLVRFEVGESLPSALVKLTQAQQWTSGSLSGIGGVRNVALAYFDLAAKQYLSFQVDGVVELVSLIGNLALVDGQPFWHLHAAVADRQGTVRAGHLVGLEIAITAECWIVPGKYPVHRHRDDFSGLNLLDI
ncbi:MAG: DUF296 domain-containing protein [bacterium]|nr:DUF296 domain-containing protein [bacterium]